MASPGTRFRLTADHLRIVRRLRVTWQGGTLPSGAPAVNPERPLLTGDNEVDVMRILGWSPRADAVDDFREPARILYGEMLYVLQILVQYAGHAVTPGLWERRDQTDDKTWEQVGD